MGYQNGHDREDENIVDLAEMRRRQLITRKKKEADERERQRKRKRSKLGGKPKVWAVVQFILFLLVVSYLMERCRGG